MCAVVQPTTMHIGRPKIGGGGRTRTPRGGALQFERLAQNADRAGGVVRRYGALPPVVVARMSPAPPAAQPCVGLTKLRASRGTESRSLGISCLVHVAPPSVVWMM